MYWFLQILALLEQSSAVIGYDLYFWDDNDIELRIKQKIPGQSNPRISGSDSDIAINPEERRWGWVGWGIKSIKRDAKVVASGNRTRDLLHPKQESYL